MNLKTMATAGVLALGSTVAMADEATPKYEYPREVALEVNAAVGRCGYILDYGEASTASTRIHLDPEKITALKINLDVLVDWVSDIKLQEEDKMDYGFTPSLTPKQCIVNLEKLAAGLETTSPVRMDILKILEIIAEPFGGREEVLLGNIEYLQQQLDKMRGE